MSIKTAVTSAAIGVGAGLGIASALGAFDSRKAGGAGSAGTRVSTAGGGGVLPPSQRCFLTGALRRNAQLTPKQTSTIDSASKRTRTWGETADRVARAAAGIRELVSSVDGTDAPRVAVISLNSDRLFELFYALPWAGCIVVPVNIRLAPPEMLELFKDCGCEYIVVDDAFSQHLAKFDELGLREAVPGFRGVIHVGDAAQGASEDGSYSSEKHGLTGVTYESLVDGAAAPAEDALRGGDDTYGIFYTGGTTGKSKGVELTHGNVFANSVGTVGAMQFDNGTRYLHSAPMFHLADAQMTFAVTRAGGTHVFIPKFTPPGTLAAIAEHKVNKALMVPVMIQYCLSIPNAASFDCSSLQTIMYGASPMAESLLARAMAQFPNSEFMQGYGMTECSPCISMLLPQYHGKGDPRMKSVGRPAPWVEAKVVDPETDEERPRGQVGEIIVRGPNVMKGYWKQPELTKKALRGGWMHTGDGAYMDEEGFLFIVDRIKDMIITGGENVYSAEVENAVMKHPRVAMCAVVGTPDERYGELVTAVCVLKKGEDVPLTLDDLRAFCKELIAGYKWVVVSFLLALKSNTLSNTLSYTHTHTHTHAQP